MLPLDPPKAANFGPTATIPDCALMHALGKWRFKQAVLVVDEILIRLAAVDILEERFEAVEQRMPIKPSRFLSGVVTSAFFTE